MKLPCNYSLTFIRRYYFLHNLAAHESPPKKKANVRKPRNYNVEKIEWTDQQRQIIDAIETRKSVFITGSAGTGKTKLIEHLVRSLVRMHGRKGVFVTASTGVAACALRGQTLQSFAGVGLAEADAGTLLSRVVSNRRTLKRWEEAKALVIDEVSMVPKALFDKLEFIARTVRSKDGECSKPWGGIQLVVSGDFLQLPPVDKECDGEEFAFEADSWDSSFQLQVELAAVFRQSNLDHIKVLQGIRRGELDEEGLELLQKCCCDKEPEESVVRLFPRIRDVDRVNNMRLKGLGEEIIVYTAFDTGLEKHQLQHGIAPSKLELCKGARVMLIKNLNVKHKLVNGATGTITGFRKVSRGEITKICSCDGDKLLPIVKFDSGSEEVIKPDTWEVVRGDKVFAKRLQLPLMLAWAMSIHKSQGMTLDRLHTDLSQAFGCGMVYVALSRLKNLDGLSLSGFDPSKIKAHPKVLEYYQKYFS